MSYKSVSRTGGIVSPWNGRDKDEEKDRESIELGPVGAFDPDRSAGRSSDACCVRRLVGSRPGAA